jgi:Mg-chelatase subunit ChlI
VGFAFVYDRAEDEIAKLCALVLADREDVRAHRKAGDLDEFLLGMGQDVIDDSEPEEMLELMTEVVRQFKARKRIGEAVGKLRQEFSSLDSQEKSEEESSDSSTHQEHRQTAVKVATVTEEKEEDEKSTNTSSSISSPADTTGQQTTSLTNPVGTT